MAGAAPAIHSEIDAAGALLGDLVGEWGPDAPEDSLAKRLANELRGTVPVVHGAGPTVAPALRWKTQINENAEAAAFASELPEADHNEICGWERGGSPHRFPPSSWRTPTSTRVCAAASSSPPPRPSAPGPRRSGVARGDSRLERCCRWCCWATW